MSIHPGFSINARMNFETSWGAEQDSGHFILPYRELGLSMKKQLFKPELNIGHVRRSHQIPWKNVVEGTITTMFFRETAYNLLKWALTRHGDNHELWSATVDKKTPIGVRRYTGVVVDKAELNFDFLRGDVALTYDLKGKLEKTAGISAFPVPSYADYDESPFVARYADVSLWGGADTKIEKLTLTVPNATEEGPPDSDGNITWLAATRRDISGSFRVVYDDDTYTDHLTGEIKGAVEVVMTHPEGGSNGTVTITLPDVLMAAAEPTTDLDGVVRQAVRFDAEMDTNENDITWSVS